MSGPGSTLKLQTMSFFILFNATIFLYHAFCWLFHCLICPQGIVLSSAPKHRRL